MRVFPPLAEKNYPPARVEGFGIFSKLAPLPNSRLQFSDENWREIESLILNAVRNTEAKLLSLDIFDTFLLRNQRSELGRFVDFAAACHALLPSRTANDFFIARRYAHNLAYRTAEKSGAFGEGRFAEMADIMLDQLGLAPDQKNSICDAEIATERSHLHPSPALAEIVRKLKKEGLQVALLTDMYLEESMVSQLIDTVYEGEFSSIPIRSSADRIHSKRSGTAFSPLAEEFDLSTSDILHIGDSFAADVHQAQAAGCRTLHFPVLRRELLQRQVDHQQVEQDLRQEGVYHDPWA